MLFPYGTRVQLFNMRHHGYADGTMGTVRRCGSTPPRTVPVCLDEGNEWIAIKPERLKVCPQNVEKVDRTAGPVTQPLHSGKWKPAIPAVPTPPSAPSSTSGKSECTRRGASTGRAERCSHARRRRMAEAVEGPRKEEPVELDAETVNSSPTPAQKKVEAKDAGRGRKRKRRSTEAARDRAGLLGHNKKLSHGLPKIIPQMRHTIGDEMSSQYASICSCYHHHHHRLLMPQRLQ